MKIPFGEFYSAVIKEAAPDLRKAVSISIRRYKDDHRLKKGAIKHEIEEQYFEELFGAVKNLTGREKQASPRDRQSFEPFTQLNNNWNVNRGDTDLAIAVYYYFYCYKADQSYARDIDLVVFKEERFASKPPPFVANVSLSPPTLPRTRGCFFGREQELNLLSDFLESSDVKVVQFVAPGGFGKTALVARFIAQLAAANFKGFEHLFEWTFYRQGDPDADAFSDDFFDQAERFFELEPSHVKSQTTRGHRLATAIAASRAIIILDGLETLQYAPGAYQKGQIKNLAIDALLRDLARKSLGLCIITTRIPIDEFGDFESKTVRTIWLDKLDSMSATQVLRSLGVRGNDTIVATAAHSVNFNPLALRLLGNWLKGEWKGDASRYKTVNFNNADARDGGHAKRLMQRYHNWLSPAHSKALILLGYFDRPARERELVTLALSLKCEEFSYEAEKLSQFLRKLFSDLVDLGLVYDFEEIYPTIDCHPVIREFELDLALSNERQWIAGNEALCLALISDVPYQPEHRAEIVELYRAVDHALNAKNIRYAWDNIIISRIWRNDYKSTSPKEEFYSTTKHNMIGEDLSRLTSFFDSPYTKITPALNNFNQRILMSQIGFLLSSTLKLHDAIDIQRTAYNLAVREKYWIGASIAAGSSAEYCHLVGDADNALKLCKAAIDARASSI